MHVHVLTAAVFALSAAFAFGAPAISADLPQSGTIKLHSSFNGNSQVVEVGEKHFMVSGNGWGVTYNDAGSGPLHMGALFCTYAVDDVNGSFNDGGGCAFGESGGRQDLCCVVREGDRQRRRARHWDHHGWDREVCRYPG